MSDAGLEHLSGLQNLARLNIYENNLVTNDGLTHLGKISSLEWLHVGATGISDEGLEQLAGLEKLKTLNVSFCPGVTGSGTDKLQDAIPGLLVAH